jgi:AraC-like DNA-binding protein
LQRIAWETKPLVVRLRTWRGRLLLQPGLGVFLGVNPTPQAHRMHVLRLVMPRQPAAFEYDGRRVQVSGPFLVPSSVAVAPPPHDDDVLALLIENNTRLGRWLNARAEAHAGLGPLVLPLDVLPFYAEAETALKRRDARRFVARLCRALHYPEPAETAFARSAAHPQIEALLQHLDVSDSLPSLRAAAQLVGLSYSHASRLFARDTGQSYAQYLRYRRLYRAIALFDGSATLTQAAHGGGFADLAHMSRTARVSFGVKLIEMLSGVQVQTARRSASEPVSAFSAHSSLFK